MNVLVIGSGGREHCLCWKLLQSSRVKKVYALPGSGGISEIAECADIDILDSERIIDFVKTRKVDLTVVGPEAPLAAGITDAFADAGLRIFGPSREAARLESSKVFCKQFLKAHQIPSAYSEAFEDRGSALGYLKTADYPLVIKADGLCAGKGVTICSSPEEAGEAIEKTMGSKVFGGAGRRIIIEDFLRGEEVSFMVLTDGEKVLPLLASQDHKAVFEGDKGPNTGGMGAYAPAQVLTSAIKTRAMEEIIHPVIRNMAEEGRPYRGLLYAGLMLTSEGPKVLEFNVRFGDPETQAVLPLLTTDIAELLGMCADGKLSEAEAQWSGETAVCVVMASKGYPGKYEKGREITGIEKAIGKGVLVFHAGTRKSSGSLLTDGGRVLGVTAAAPSVKEAIDSAYAAVRKIRFEGAYYREDIGWKALKHDKSNA